ncbi:unnamed protein product [Caenorhabditis angaria]|uniref:Uncharacterized protein n=1 Tax=Caenorhabditis angaria TaxID=860376 RepID=A0A9P1N7E1_9PELO|nr:unnamed protein product [Caenorhabditis angaria]
MFINIMASIDSEHIFVYCAFVDSKKTLKYVIFPLGIPDKLDPINFVDLKIIKNIRKILAIIEKVDENT